MPCDVLGLEPGWMSENYDDSTSKAWHPQRFPIPYWAPRAAHLPRRAEAQGFKLSLWLCCDYDLGVYEEQLLSGRAPSGAKRAAKGAGVNVVDGLKTIASANRRSRGKRPRAGDERAEDP